VSIGLVFSYQMRRSVTTPVNHRPACAEGIFLALHGRCPTQESVVVLSYAKTPSHIDLDYVDSSRLDLQPDARVPEYGRNAGAFVASGM